jgi:integrase
VWRAAVKKAKLPHGTRFHELRHFHASLLIRHGESVKTVQARLGHASAVETLNTYGTCGPIRMTAPVMRSPKYSGIWRGLHAAWKRRNRSSSLVSVSCGRYAGN